MSTRTRERSDSGPGTGCRAVAAEPGEDACRVLVDESGRIAAYAWFGANWWMGVRRRDLPGAFHIAEGMARDAEAADTLLVACRTWAEEAEAMASRIALAIPPEGPVAMAAAYEGGQMLAVYTRGGNFMGRVLDLGRLLRLLRPELAARVRSARLPFQGRLTFRTDEDEAAIVIRDDDVLVDGGARRRAGRRAAPDGAGTVVPRWVRPRGCAGAPTESDPTRKWRPCSVRSSRGGCRTSTRWTDFERDVSPCRSTCLS